MDSETLISGYNGQISESYQNHFHGGAVISVLKGTDHGLASGVNINYFRLLHITGFFEALEMVTEVAESPAILIICNFPAQKNRHPQDVQDVRRAFETLVNEKDAIVLVGAGNYGDNKMIPNRTLRAWRTWMFLVYREHLSKLQC